jgi:uroporphyrinogen decarboxylase
MNSKERVLAALSHQPSDRIPLTMVHGYIVPEMERRLKEHYYLYGVETLHPFFKLDTQWIEPVYVGPPLGVDQEGNRLGIWGTPEYIQTYSERFRRPLAEITSVAEVEAYPWPQIEWFDFSTIPQMANLYRDYAVICPRRWSPVFDRIAELMGFETFLINLITQPKVIEALVEKITDWNCQMWQRVLDAAPGMIDICYTGEDPAGQLNLLIRPELWRRYFKPAYARLFEIAHSRGAYVMFHICGNATPILPDLIEIGMDILMPVQVSAKDMDPARLKREYGREITFWGGVDTQHLLPNGTPDQVRREVRRLIDILGEGGGFVLASTHNLTADIPIENIWAMYDEAARYYPFV